MWRDPVVNEVRQVRDELAEKFNYDPDAILSDVRQRQSRHGSRLVRRQPRPIKAHQDPLGLKTVAGITE